MCACAVVCAAQVEAGISAPFSGGAVWEQLPVLEHLRVSQGWGRVQSAGQPGDEAIAELWRSWWRTEGTHRETCGGRLVCLLSGAKFELDSSVPRPLYATDVDGKLVPAKQVPDPQAEPYACQVQRLAVDFSALASLVEDGGVFSQKLEARGFSLAGDGYPDGSLRLGGCRPPAPPRAWRAELRGRCLGTQILTQASRALRAVSQHAEEPACAVSDPRTTALVVRHAVSNLWEAHFALVEAAARLAALGLLPRPGAERAANASQVVLLPPDSANTGLPGASLELWSLLLGGRVVSARDVRPRAVHCFDRAALISDFCCEAGDLCPASSWLPVPPRSAGLSGLPCAAHAGGAGCAYGLARGRLRAALGERRRAAAPPEGPGAILVSRRTASNRRVLQEDALAEALGRLLQGRLRVRLVDFASLPILEQAAVVARAEQLAGVHGAGLTHMLFLPAHASVAEVALREGWHDVDGPKGSPPMYAEMAQRLGLGYASWLYDGPLGQELDLNLSAPVMASLMSRAHSLR
ncbi:unnamed protein product [Prorocentrum cordatum]|uniref:Glycosyltransferase 61 catalytic domain-containing protein n=1 Tax=Prorocentrum cordatum TaxID=2364126 RepID=A0ABN9QS59_9DINO|nr:unnamed protein product [Polarella glacialis]